ncbi:hypothetical protein CF394_10760 [Tetzosporium hominis]|uniref:Uncharacterized protein n=1 Tax=Tetzosporium hominis TaxID=2020506 RepID=A0A264W272_9BACL|nr:hypothetical protein CF394_10760 [Tetzosporium hominis]
MISGINLILQETAPRSTARFFATCFAAISMERVKEKIRVPWLQSGLKNPQRRPKRKLWYAARILMATPTDKRVFSERSQQKFMWISGVRNSIVIRCGAPGDRRLFSLPVSEQGCSLF